MDLPIGGTSKSDPWMKVKLAGNWVGTGKEGRETALGHGRQGAEGDGSEDDGVDHYEGNETS